MLADTPVVTCFLRNRGEVLLLRRSGEVGSYRGRWGGIAGHVESGDADRSALREIAEESGLENAVQLLRRGESFPVEDRDLEKRWIVHPYLFDCDRRDARIDWESVESEWVSPTEILRRDCVPRLWTSYEKVAPTLASISSDREHGSGWLSLRALEVLRDRAGVLRSESVPPETAWRELEELARGLVSARSSMAAIENRVARVLERSRESASAETVEEQAHRAIGRAVDDDEASARRAADLVAGKCVLTLSRSGTIRSALLHAHPRPRVVVAESRPGGEGVRVAEELAAAGLEVTLVSDAATAEAVASLGVEIVLVGADAVLPSGAVVNKTGTRLAALAARDAGISFYAVAATDKISAREEWDPEPSDPREVYEGSARIGVRNHRFELTPGRLIDAIVTERGLVGPDEVSKRV